MSKPLMAVMILAIFLSACGGKPEPTISAANVQVTAAAIAGTIIAQTQAAIPTATPIPPTDTPAPTLTDAPILIPTLEVIPPLPTSTSSSNSCTALTKWDGHESKVNLNNSTKGSANLSLCRTSEAGACECISRQFDNSTSIMMPLGCYSAWAWITGKRNFTVSGSFCITQPQAWSVFVENDAVRLKAGCSPNC